MFIQYIANEEHYTEVILKIATVKKSATAKNFAKTG